MRDLDAIIVGAGPAGLACAATMRTAGLNVSVLEKADTVGSAWRRHYDRLHLHTDRKHSGLPGMAMPVATTAMGAEIGPLAVSAHQSASFRRRPETSVPKAGRISKCAA